MKHKCYGIFLSLMVFALGLELGAFLLLHLLPERVYGGRFTRETTYYLDRLDDDFLQTYYQTTFHSRLGWKPKANLKGHKENSKGARWDYAIDQYGARQNPYAPATKNPYIAAFGDSFTFGDEVNDNETWPAYLSKRLARRVANYGVGGYGTGQALLNFKEELKNGLKPKIAILGIFQENILRIVNRYRPFYYSDTGLKAGFKPRAMLAPAGRLTFLDQTLKTKTYDEKQLANAIHTARSHDFWAKHNPKMRFPFSLSLLKGVMAKQCQKDNGQFFCKGVLQSGWQAEPFTRLMRALIDEFILTANEAGIKPVILFIDMDRPSNYAAFITRLRRDYDEKSITIIDLLDAEFNRDLMTILPTAGHLSPYGNALLADFIAVNLEK